MKTEYNEYERDERTSALLNNDRAAYEAYKMKRDASLKQRKTEEEISNLKSEISDIKEMLKILIRRDSNG